MKVSLEALRNTSQWENAGVSFLDTTPLVWLLQVFAQESLPLHQRRTVIQPVIF